eukprot:TRINITY_DN18578_c0_g1_i1.p2 TRINITY_DN18578_c0_g1~~TRINITY_DN18578_c0_g1_i1.p2  ORF type:complete len:102 (-),score=21.70 TRINITY_DN18578_c0_g1_i1:51-356(-)
MCIRDSSKLILLIHAIPELVARNDVQGQCTIWLAGQAPMEQPSQRVSESQMTPEALRRWLVSTVGEQAGEHGMSASRLPEIWLTQHPGACLLYTSPSPRDS